LLETWVDRVGPHPAPLRPNIVFILTDDQRFDTIGLTHSIDGVTPVMPTVQHEILDKGVSFLNSYATTDLCAPSRSSLLAGKYAHTTGVHDNGGPDGGFGSLTTPRPCRSGCRRPATTPGSTAST
jgi:arylsulfatase A-like enzyme